MLLASINTFFKWLYLGWGITIIVFLIAKPDWFYDLKYIGVITGFVLIGFGASLFTERRIILGGALVFGVIALSISGFYGIWPEAASSGPLGWLILTFLYSAMPLLSPIAMFVAEDYTYLDKSLIFAGFLMFIIGIHMALAWLNAKKPETSTSRISG